MALKIVTVVGARPQFIKAAALSRQIVNEYSGQIKELILHTGQHYDENMSDVFFEQMHIPKPAFHLTTSSSRQGAMTGKMLTEIEQILTDEKPDALLVYGDTNSTLAGALAAAKLHIPVAHVEAGLRSFNKKMPEEINRILTDHVSDRLYCPTETACANLATEGVTQGVMNSGDIMLDVANYYGPLAIKNSSIISDLGLESQNFVLATIHRAENTDDPTRISEIFKAFARIAKVLPIVLPLHPRTRKVATQLGLNDLLKEVVLLDPLPFWDVVVLQQMARVIVTDSGGVQKEAYFYATPCVTIRDQTEWVETLEDGWNQLVATDVAQIVDAVLTVQKPSAAQKPYFGKGCTAEFIVRDLIAHL